MVTAIIFSALLGSQSLSPFEKLKGQNATQHYVADFDEGVIFKVPQPIPKFACMKDFSVLHKGDREVLTVVMLAKRPKGKTDSEVIDFRWSMEQPSGKTYEFYLIILEGGRTPHQNLRGKISRSRCVAISAAKQTTIVGTFYVLRKGTSIIVSLPSKLLSGYKLEQVCSRWLPAKVKEPFKSNGIFEYATNSVVFDERYSSYGVGSMTGTLDELK